MRWLIASLVSPDTDQVLRRAYPSCRVKTLHLTFIPPFTTHTPAQLPPLPPLNQLQYQSEPPEIFHRQRQILYLPLTPAAPLSHYFSTLLPLVRPQITFESPDFPNDTIPPFLPHITLDYDFNPPLNWSLPALTLTLLPPQLLLEQAPGIWKPYAF